MPCHFIFLKNEINKLLNQPVQLRQINSYRPINTATGPNYQLVEYGDINESNNRRSRHPASHLSINSTKILSNTETSRTIEHNTTAGSSSDVPAILHEMLFAMAGTILPTQVVTISEPFRPTSTEIPSNCRTEPW